MNLRDDLMRHLSYNQKTGVFKWKIVRPHRPAGSSIAGTIHPYGYRIISFRRRFYRGGRLAWLFMTGAWPKNEIDHKNGIRHDDSWKNLRAVTRAENTQNVTKSKGVCGLVGVRKTKNGKRFAANIAVDRARFHLGTFDTPEQARRAYLKAKRIYHPAGVFRA
jgi:hypothetical protein